jgi:ribosomal protein S18 acetylase RimI-like enzyme
MEKGRIKIIHYNVLYSKEPVLMWRESKEKAIGRKEIHSFSDHEHYLNNVLSKNNEIYIALDYEKVVGMTAFNESEINQLYIHNDYQRMGIGKRPLDLAKNKSKGRLTLYTFEINKKAQRFYERNGFKIIGRGCENEEKMDDIKYEWIR